MYISFNKIRYSNIMTIGQNPITIDLNSHKKTLIVGGNGTAKSTLIEAINFALYGKPYRDIKRNQLVNTVNKAKLLVELWMSIGDKEVLITRGIKPNIFTIAVNGVELPVAPSVREQQQQLEDIIEISELLFKQMIVLGTANFKPFLTYSTAERKASIEEFIGLSIIGEMDRHNKDLLRELNQSIKVGEMKVDHLEQQIKSNKTFIEKQTEDVEKNKRHYLESIDIIKVNLREDKVVLDDVKLGVSGDRADQEETSKEIQESQKLTQTINNYIIEFTAKKKQAEDLLKMYEAGGTCPVCHQDVKNGDKEPVLLSIKDYESKINRLIERKNETNAKLIDLNNRKAVYDSKITKLTSISSKINQGISKINELQKELDRIESLDSTDHFVKEIKSLRKELNQILKDNTKLVSEKYLRGIVTDLFKEDGIKSVLLKKYIPYFNSRVRHYLQIMEADYEFTLDETFNETIRSRGREGFTYNSFSQGEKTRIDIAILFTWRDVSEQVSGTKISMLIMDEVFDSALDMVGIEAIHQIIDKMDRVYTYIISHRDQDINVYDRIIKTSKTGQFSKIDIEDLSDSIELP